MYEASGMYGLGYVSEGFQRDAKARFGHEDERIS